MPLERELKFRIKPSAAARAAKLLALPAKGRTVSSTYFDTADEQLRQARMALRLRRDGKQWLQTVKSEISAAVRGEWETPARGRLDLASLPRDEILAATGVDIALLGERLRPRFETRFIRRSRLLDLGKAQVEVALDRGAAIAGTCRESISELEVELKTGAMQKLLRYAESLVEPLGLQLAFESKAERGYRLARGETRPAPRKWRRPELAPSATTGVALRELAGAALSQAGMNALGVLEAHDDPEYLHQLRVGLRRLRSTLSVFRKIVKTQALRRRLGAFSPVLGAARDWDVFVQWLVHAKAPRRLLAAAKARQVAARRAARALVGSHEFNIFLLRALRWIEESRSVQAGAPLSRFARQVLQRLHRKTLRRARRIDWQNAAARHELRIRVKRLRYACDSFAVETHVDGLVALQERLGQLNDIAVAKRFLAQLGGEASLRAKLERSEARLIQRLQGAWFDFEQRAPIWKAGK